MSWSESAHFANWLKRQPNAKIRARDANFVTLNDKLSMADLISIMYHGEDARALKALKMLRQHFEREMDHANPGY